MMTLRVVCFIAALLCGTARAQICSGGADGGMDATGNQCNAPGTYVDSALTAAVLAQPAAAVVPPALASLTPAGVDRLARPPCSDKP